MFVLTETNTTFEVEKIIFIIFLINYIYYIFNCICLTSFTYKVIRACSIISIYSIWIKSTADFARSRGNYFLIIFFWRCSPRICFATHAWLKARLKIQVCKMFTNCFPTSLCMHAWYLNSNVLVVANISVKSYWNQFICQLISRHVTNRIISDGTGFYLMSKVCFSGTWCSHNVLFWCHCSARTCWILNWWQYSLLSAYNQDGQF